MAPKNQKEASGNGKQEWTSILASKGERVGSGMAVNEMSIRFVESEKYGDSLTVRLGRELAEKIDAKEGDCIDLLINGDKTKGLVRKAEKGLKLRDSGAKALEFSSGWAQKRRSFELPAKQTLALSYEITDDGIEFDIPAPAPAQAEEAQAS